MLLGSSTPQYTPPPASPLLLFQSFLIFWQLVFDWWRHKFESGDAGFSYFNYLIKFATFFVEKWFFGDFFVIIETKEGYYAKLFELFHKQCSVRVKHLKICFFLLYVYVYAPYWQKLCCAEMDEIWKQKYYHCFFLKILGKVYKFQNKI